jgi:hypothetical protein
MRSEHGEDLEARLHAAEQQLAQARKEILALRNMATTGKWKHTFAISFLLAVIAILGAQGRFSTVHAQGEGGTPKANSNNSPSGLEAGIGAPPKVLNEGIQE